MRTTTSVTSPALCGRPSDLFQGVEEETARRLGLASQLDHADLRRRITEVVPDPAARTATRLWP